MGSWARHPYSCGLLCNEVGFGIVVPFAVSLHARRALVQCSACLCLWVQCAGVCAPMHTFRLWCLSMPAKQCQVSVKQWVCCRHFLALPACRFQPDSKPKGAVGWWQPRLLWCLLHWEALRSHRVCPGVGVVQWNGQTLCFAVGACICCQDALHASLRIYEISARVS